MEILCLLLYIISFFLQYQTGFSSYNYSSTSKIPLCRQEQRQLLLQLKQQLPPDQEDYFASSMCPKLPKNYCKTMFWNQSSDCCLWEGVTCDQSGHVIGLDLSCGALTGEIDSNSSIFRLSHLRKLNLAENNFTGSEISSKFGWLNSLTHLNLSHSSISGQIPLEFYYLSHLVLLDLSSNYFPGVNINGDVKLLFGNMTKIRVVMLRGVNISSEMPTNMSSILTHLDLSETGIHGKLPATIFEKPNLKVLRLSGNYGLIGSLPKSLNRSNVHFIKELDLSSTSITGRVSESIGFMSNLHYMGLFYCKFSGPIPESIGNITEITYIDFSDNEFSGQVPSTISNLRRLTSLDLSDNHLEGQLPDAFSNLRKLTYLDLSHNSLVGPIPSSLTNMSQLEDLDISYNALTGPFPSRAGHGLQKLWNMDLSHNSILSMLPSWLLSLPLLRYLDLSFNRLTGQTGEFNCEMLHHLALSNNHLKIELRSFYNLSNIRSLDISYNTITEHGSEIVNVTFPALKNLQLSSCEIKEFPSFLTNILSLQLLDLSDNKIHGPIPSWFRSIRWLEFSSLNLSSNFLTYVGYLPWQNLQYLGLHSNLLRGTFPLSICDMSRLSILNLSNNKFGGKIPKCIGNSSSQLWVVDLRKNEFHGKIPSTLGENDELFYLGLSDNHLEGPLPRSLANCTGLEVLDLGNNIIQDTFPWWLETLPKFKILILRSNRFHGSIRPPFSNHSFSELQIIDLSHNNFNGLLPEKLFARLHAMRNMDQAATYDQAVIHAVQSKSSGRTCDYWSSCLRGDPGPTFYSGGYQYSVRLLVKGVDVELTRELRIFTTIDLSSNNFQGRIPESIAYLYSLRLVNLSHNNINGSIPPALGQMKNLEQLDLSSNQLTGGIPQTLTNLTFLAFLNLSHNHLFGPIPQANQFLTFSNDSYVGNSGLCGAPLTKSCGDDKVPPSPVESEDGDDDVLGLMMGFTWKAVVMGYVLPPNSW